MGNNRAQPSAYPVPSTRLQRSLSQGSQHGHWVFTKTVRLWFKPQNEGEAEDLEDDGSEKQTQKGFISSVNEADIYSAVSEM